MIEYSKNAELVDAIEEGKIVRVPEDYARREGLLILRKSASLENSVPKEKKEEDARKNKGFIGMDDLRKPLSTKNNDLLKELVENFHWILLQKRKARGLTRKKVADSIGESELNLKIIENGVLPMNNFILVNKLESFYGVSLRKNRVAENKAPLRQIIDFKKKEQPNKTEKNSEEIINLDYSEKGRVGNKAEKLDLPKDEDDFIDLSKL